MVIRRAADRTRAPRRSGRIVCPSSVCAQVIDQPARRCETCGRSIEGGYGRRRRCACGARIPAAGSPAEASAPACPRCGTPLDRAAWSAGSVVVPVVGAPGAGKTRLVGAIAHALASGPATTFRPGGAQADHLVALERAVATGAQVAPTPMSHSQAYELVVTGGERRSTLLQLHDLAGRRYRNDADLDRLRCLDVADGVLIVVDPTSVPSISAQLPDPDGSRRVASDDLLSAHALVLARLSDVERRGRVAVVVSKVDEMVRTASGRSLTAAAAVGEVAAWLEEVDQAPFVRAVRSTFEEVGWFATCAVAGLALDVGSPAAPARWLFGEDDRPGASPALVSPGPASEASAVGGSAGPGVATAVSPGLLVIVLDRSASMAGPVAGGGRGERLGDRAAAVVDEMLFELMVLVDGSPSRAGAISVAVIGHGGAARPLLGADRTGRDLMAADELRAVARWSRSAEPGVDTREPCWVEPRASGEPDRKGAFELVQALVDRSRLLAPEAPEALVVEVTAAAAGAGTTSVAGVPVRRVVIDDDGSSAVVVTASLAAALGVR